MDCLLVKAGMLQLILSDGLVDRDRLSLMFVGLVKGMSTLLVALLA